MPDGSKLRLEYQNSDARLDCYRAGLYHKTSFRSNYQPMKPQWLSIVKDDPTRGHYFLACEIPVKAGEILVPSLHAGAVTHRGDVVRYAWVIPTPPVTPPAPATIPAK